MKQVLDWTRWRFQTYLSSQAAGADVRKLVQLAHLRVMICGWKYHLNYIIPQCQRVNTTPRLSRFLDEADNQEFILIFLGSQFNERFYLFPLKGALIVGTKNSRKVIITRQTWKIPRSHQKPFFKGTLRQQGISTFEFPFYFDLFCILFSWKFNPQRWTGEWISIRSERKKRVE